MRRLTTEKDYRTPVAVWLAPAAWAAWLMFAVCTSAAGDEPADEEPRAPPPPATRESWTGVDVTRANIAIWSGLTWSPLGAVQDDGLRLRLVAGAGRYTYDGWTLVGGLPAPAHFLGQSRFLDALAGYHIQLGTLTLKPFAGISIAQQAVTPFDPVNPLGGRTLGLKLALETWLRFGDHVWLNVDGSWTTVHATAAGRARLGLRVWQDLSAGIEASVLSDVNQEMRRAGLFVRYAWDRGEISLGGGLTAHSWAQTLGAEQFYAGATYLRRF